MLLHRDIHCWRGGSEGGEGGRERGKGGRGEEREGKKEIMN